MFNRPPRIQTPRKEYELALIPPPQIPPKPTINWATVGLPIFAVGLVLALMIFFSKSTSYLSYAMFLPFMLASVVASVISWRSQTKQNRVIRQSQIAAFGSELENKGNKIDDYKSKQLATQLQINPSPQECLEIVSREETRVGERRPADGDFLTFRLGLGTGDSQIRVKGIPTENRDPGYGSLYDEADKLMEHAKMLEHAPVLCDLKEVGSIGVAGKVDDLREFGWAAAVQLLTHHWPAELNIAAFSSFVETENWKWLNQVRHKSPIFQHAVIELRQTQGVKKALVILEEELRRRKSVFVNLRAIGSERVTHVNLPALVVIFDRVSGVYNHAAFALLLKEGRELGVYGIFLTDSVEEIPAECGAIVLIETTGISYRKTGENQQSINKIEPDRMSVASVETYSNKLASIKWLIPQQVTEPPEHLTLLELFPYARLDDLPLASWWGGKHPFGYLRAPIGKFSPTAELIFDLNESDTGHGPHGLIGGMTGSGKSELLKTMILSLALTHHPYDLNFALVDYKGGGAFDGFEALPHVVGVITDIQNHADYATRVIQSLAWEVKRRERILADARKNFDLTSAHIDEYRAKLKVKIPIPRLIIIFDEFAEFQEHHQEESKKLINIARVGRSLGIHLILCTQNPMGKAVDQQVRDNSKFTICLKVKTPETSKGLVNIPDAVQLRTGEAYFHVDGPQKFKVAYTRSEFSLSKAVNSDTNATTPYRKYQIQEVSEAQAIIEEISLQDRELAIPIPPKIWQEPLPDLLTLSDLIRSSGENPNWTGTGWAQDNHASPSLPLGLLDDPLHQKQPVFAVRDHLLLFGASGSGKSTALLTAAMSIGMMYSPAEAHIYCFDISGQSPLKLLETSGMPHLPRQGGIIHGSDIERSNRLFKMLRTIIVERGKKIASKQIQTSKARIQEPYTFVLIDGISKQFNNDNPGFQQQLDFVMRHGAALGVYVLLTGNLSIDVPEALRADRNIILLQGIAPGEILSLVGRAPETYQKKVAAGQEPGLGRGILNANPALEFQCAMPFAPEEQTLEGFSAVLEAMGNAWSGPWPPDVEKLAESIPLSEIVRFEAAPAITVGKGLESLEPVGFSLVDDGPLFMIVSMTSGLGKTSALYLCLSQIVKNHKPRDLKVILIDYHSRTLRHFAKLPHLVNDGTVHTHVTQREDLKGVVDWLSNEVSERRNKLAKAYANSPQTFDDKSMVANLGKILLVIDDYESFVTSVPTDLNRLTKTIIEGEEVGVRLILTENHAILGIPPLRSDELILRAKKYATGILLGGSAGLEAFNNVRPPNNQITANLLPGRGYLVKHGQAELIQVAAYWKDGQKQVDAIRHILGKEAD